MADKNIHAAHRERMRKKYLAGGRESMPDHELLEILLFSVIPRRNTNDIAHRLLNTFYSLDGVLQADYELLRRVEGVGDKTAFFLSQLSFFFYRSELGKTKRRSVDSTEKLGKFLISQFKGLKKEVVLLLMLDNASNLIGTKKIDEGTVNSSAVSARTIAEAALSGNASSIVLAHNHPDGLAVPSQEDIALTHQLAVVFSKIDVPLEEHFVVAGDQYYPILAEMRRKAAFL